jgi:hypothetical protein
LGAISSIGIGVPDKEFGPRFENSTQTSTGLEYRVSDNSSFAGQLTFDNYQYRSTSSTYAVNSRLKATGLVFSYRHRFGKGGWRPYLKAGGGLMRFSIPTANTAQGFTTVGNRVEVVSVASAEAGVQFRVYRRFSIFTGAERAYMGKSDLMNTSLRVTNFKLGLISSL